jgi:hypothetical protein
MQSYADNFIPVIPIEEGYLLHTPDKPFCPVDPACPCHEDPELLAEVNQFVQAGLMTPQEATDFVTGQTI